MAKKSDGFNRSEEIRQLLKTNPKIGSKEAVAKLAEKGIQVSNGLFYFVKGQIKGRKSRRTKAQTTVTNVSEVTHGKRSDAVTTILKVKAFAKEVGGMKTLKALVEALID